MLLLLLLLPLPPFRDGVGVVDEDEDDDDDDDSPCPRQPPGRTSDFLKTMLARGPSFHSPSEDITECWKVS